MTVEVTDRNWKGRSDRGVGSLSSWNLGRSFKKLRLAAGFTQSEISEALGWDQASISRIENLVTKMGIEQLIDVIEFFDTSADALLRGDDVDEQAIKNKFARLKKEGKPTN